MDKLKITMDKNQLILSHVRSFHFGARVQIEMEKLS